MYTLSRQHSPIIIVTSPNNRTQFGLLPTLQLPDLCAVGTNQPARAIPRRR